MFINRTSFIPREQEGQALFSSYTKSLRTEYLFEARYYAFFENPMMQIFLAQVRLRDKTLLFRQAVSYILNYSSLCGFRCNHHILLWIEKDVNDQKLFLKSPKSGRQSEVVFIPKKVADRLREYIRANGFKGDQQIFPMGYTGAREIVKREMLLSFDLRGNTIERFPSP